MKIRSRNFSGACADGSPAESDAPSREGSSRGNNSMMGRLTEMTAGGPANQHTPSLRRRQGYRRPAGRIPARISVSRALCSRPCLRKDPDESRSVEFATSGPQAFPEQPSELIFTLSESIGQLPTGLSGFLRPNTYSGSPFSSFAQRAAAGHSNGDRLLAETRSGGFPCKIRRK